MDSSIAKDRLSAVIKPDSITTTQGDFLTTHVTIKRLLLLKKFELVPTSTNYYSEEEIYKRYILNPSNSHQFIAVYGQSGTGKSHLIRWFEARYSNDKPEDEVILFIRRSDNTLKGTIRQLLEKPEVRGISNKDIIKRLTNASVTVAEDKLKDMIYHNFIIEANNDEDKHSISLTNVKRKRLVTFLNNETIHDHMMEADGPIDRIYSKIAENSMVDRDIIAQFKPDDFLVSVDLYTDMEQAGADPKALKTARALMANDAFSEAEKFSDYLNQFVSEVIQRCAGIEPGDFEQVFMDIRKELYRLGKNLTLFIEDITSFTGVDNALLNVLIEYHAERNICRISSIVGGTNNYLENNFLDNHKDRITQYVYIPSDAFDEDGIYEFVGRYLNAMSLPESSINQWLEHKATPEEYPVHNVIEGKKWEYVTVGCEKRLCLYPFTKNSIRYLYNHVLEKGHQTPRYIIRDILEPVVSDVLYNQDKFPSIKFDITNINTTLSFMIHNQIADAEQADRMFRFMSIWGNNEAKQYTYDGIVYIAGMRREQYEDFGLPILNLQEAAVASGDTGDPVTKSGTSADSVQEAVSANQIASDQLKKLSDANAILTQWTNGMPINLSTTGGAEGTIRTAREDMCEFLFSAINWQAEGISMDHIEKIKGATSGRASKYKLVALENQTKGEGYYVLPANWNSLNVINAFIRWREYGSQSWNYPESDFDIYLITSWTYRIKTHILNAVCQFNGNQEVKYIEAAIAAEMYRLILYGEFTGKSLNKLTYDYLFRDQPLNNTGSGHSDAWNALLTVMRQDDADSINRATVRNYFNLSQGTGRSVVVLDAIKLQETFNKVKKNKLQIPVNEIHVDDNVKLRRDVYLFLNDITNRVESVAKAEVQCALAAIQPIYDQFDDEEIDENNIELFVTMTKNFYKEIGNTQINIPDVSTNSLKRQCKQIAKAIKDINAALDEKDPLTILLAFSEDPIAALQPLGALLKQVATDVQEVERQLAVRIADLGDTGGRQEPAERYKEELAVINVDLALLESIR